MGGIHRVEKEAIRQGDREISRELIRCVVGELPDSTEP